MQEKTYEKIDNKNYKEIKQVLPVQTIFNVVEDENAIAVYEQRISEYQEKIDEIKERHKKIENLGLDKEEVIE